MFNGQIEVDNETKLKETTLKAFPCHFRVYAKLTSELISHQTYATFKNLT